MTRRLIFDLTSTQKIKVKPDYSGWDILETEEQALQRLKDRIVKLDSLLDNMCSYYHYDINSWHSKETNTTGYEVHYCITEKNKGIKWNDIYKTVNSTGQGVPYKFLK